MKLLTCFGHCDIKTAEECRRLSLFPAKSSRALHEVLRQFHPRSPHLKSLKLPIVGEDQHSRSTTDEREAEKGHPLLAYLLYALPTLVF